MITGEKVGNPTLPNCYKAYSSDLISSLLSSGPSFVCSPCTSLGVFNSIEKPTGQLKGIIMVKAEKGLEITHAIWARSFSGKVACTSDLRSVSIYTICQMLEMECQATQT